MKYRLDVQHYVEDKLLEAGVEVGDGCSVSWRDVKGHALEPSVGMTPIDDEAKKAFETKFGKTKPDIDPTKPIPVMGNVKATASTPAKGPVPIKVDVPVGSPLTKD